MRILLVAQSGGGKTNLLMKFLIGDAETPPLLAYDEIYIYTNTPKQKKYQALNAIYSEISKNTKVPPFHTITNAPVPSVNEFDDKAQKVVVFDDLLCSDTKVLKTIAEYYVLGRHKNIQPIFLSQSYYAIPSVIRKNTNLFCIFGLTQRREIEAVVYDHDLSSVQFQANTKDHDFVTINKNKRTIYRNIDEELN
jgi:hypothetical protein